MGLSRLDEIARGLVSNGKDPQTPAAVIASGTLPGQEIVTAPLVDVAEAAADLESPTTTSAGDSRSAALVVVGEVVSLQPVLRSAAAIPAIERASGTLAASSPAR